jgi:hypothetical protein
MTGRRRHPLIALVAVLVATAVIGLPRPALATTGPTPLAHPPRFSVTDAQAAPYLGRFRLVQPFDRQLISGAYLAGHNERGFVEGSIAVYHYEAAGRETVLLGRTYEYHAVGDEMTIDVISPQNQVILARMRLHPVGGSKLTGTLTSLLPPGPARRVTFAPVSAAGTAPPTADPSPAAEPEDAGPVETKPTPPASAAEIAAAVMRLLSPF